MTEKKSKGQLLAEKFDRMLEAEGPGPDTNSGTGQAKGLDNDSSSKAPDIR